MICCLCGTEHEGPMFAVRVYRTKVGEGGITDLGRMLRWTRFVCDGCAEKTNKLFADDEPAVAACTYCGTDPKTCGCEV